MIRKLVMVGAALIALLVPIGIAAAATVGDGVPIGDDGAESTVPGIQSVNPNCDGDCVGFGPGAGPRDGSGPLHEGPRDGTGNRFGRSGDAAARNGAGIGIGPRDGTGPIHDGPADGTGNRFGVAFGSRNPDDGMACDGTRRHAPNVAVSSS